jgi:hypothetical protein
LFISSVLICLFESANALSAKTGGRMMETLDSWLEYKLYCMDFFSANGPSCITSKSQHVSVRLWCRTATWLWGKRTLQLKWCKIYMELKVESWNQSMMSLYQHGILSSNLHAGSIKQSRHKNFEQNHDHFNENFGESINGLGRTYCKFPSSYLCCKPVITVTLDFPPPGRNGIKQLEYILELSIIVLGYQVSYYI